MNPSAWLLIIATMGNPAPVVQEMPSQQMCEVMRGMGQRDAWVNQTVWCLPKNPNGPSFRCDPALFTDGHTKYVCRSTVTAPSFQQ